MDNKHPLIEPLIDGTCRLATPLRGVSVDGGAGGTPDLWMATDLWMETYPSMEHSQFGG